MTRSPNRRKPVLIIQHAPHEHPAAMRRALETQAIPTHWIHPYLGDQYPELQEISGVISLGGPMGANDEDNHAWVGQEIDLIKRAVLEEVPTVGICLGAQMMARGLGGKVERHTVAEVGWFPITVNALGLQDPIAGAAGLEPVVYHWHEDTFHLPPGAELLAESAICERQAFRIGTHAYGFQFHPEADHQLVGEWLECDGIEEELIQIQRLHNKKTVQDRRTQKAKTLEGEKGSLKITAAIGGLFHKRDFFPVNPRFKANLEEWAQIRKRLMLEFLDSELRLARIYGTISSLLSVPAGDFLIFEEDSTLLWPIRLDDIKNIISAS